MNTLTKGLRSARLSRSSGILLEKTNIVSNLNWNYSTGIMVKKSSTSSASHDNDTTLASKEANRQDSELAMRGKLPPKTDTGINIPRELQFTTPYGHLAVKEWGNSAAPNKIICLHGWLDNAGSFDPLIPLLLDTRERQDMYHILAMDEPGIGFSSHKPAGADYSKHTALIEVKRIVDRLKWDKMSIIGHSMGASNALIYACLFPDQVENVVSIDMTQPITQSARGWETRSASSIKDYLKYEQQVEDDPAINDKIPVYSENEALKRIMESHGSSLNEQSARIIMKRGAKKRRWGYTFTRDIRLRVQPIDPFPTDEAMLQYMKAFRANLLVIRGKQSIYQTSEASRLQYYSLYQSQCKLFRESQIDGTHHLHMNGPKPVAELVKSFLEEAENLRKQLEAQADTKPGPDSLKLTKSKL